MNSLHCAVLSVLLALSYAATVGHDRFGHRISKGQLIEPALDDISGMVASRIHDGIMYVHNYQYDGNFLYAVNVNSASLVATWRIQGAVNFDWEDIAYGPCVDDCQASPCSASVKPSRYCIYIADIGSHSGLGAADVIYMVREPSTIASGDLSVVSKLTFSWSEKDAESLFIAPDGRLFILSKVSGGRAMLAELPASGWNNTINLDLANTGILKILTTHNDPQGADLSPDGKELLLVAEEEIFYYYVPDGDYINAVRTTIPESVYGYVAEPNTEGIAWAPDAQGFYVIPRNDNPPIFYFPRDDTSIVG